MAKWIKWYECPVCGEHTNRPQAACSFCKSKLERDETSEEALKQVMWERDLALTQLAEIGKGLGAKMDDVQKVVTCRDCDYSIENGFICANSFRGGRTFPNGFCSNGAPKGEEVHILAKKSAEAHRRCFDCMHYEACQSWNIGSLMDTDATHCVNYREPANVESVVRCGECRFWDDDTAYCRMHGSYTMTKTDFCSQGRKREPKSRLFSEQMTYSEAQRAFFDACAGQTPDVKERIKKEYLAILPVITKRELEENDGRITG